MTVLVESRGQEPSDMIRVRPFDLMPLDQLHHLGDVARRPGVLVGCARQMGEDSGAAGYRGLREG